MKTTTANPFLNPWRWLTIFTLAVATPFALFVLIKLGDNPDLLTRQEPNVVVWNPIHDIQAEHDWVCRQLADYHPIPELVARYDQQCKEK